MPADGLAWWGGMPPELLAIARTRLPPLAEIADEELYLCAGCVEVLIREQLATREEIARGHGLSAKLIAKAWIHDEEFWRRGPESAPAEVIAQPWWADYQALVTAPQQQLLMGADLELAEATARGRWKTDVQELLRRYAADDQVGATELP